MVDSVRRKKSGFTEGNEGNEKGQNHVGKIMRRKALERLGKRRRTAGESARVAQRLICATDQTAAP
jgi:hypothetical protein